MPPIPSVQELTNYFNSISAVPSSQEAQTALARFDQLAPDTAALSSAIGGSLGVDALRSRVGDLRKSIIDTENAIQGVGDSVLGRTSNSLVSQAQVDALTRKEQQPLFENLGRQNQALEFGSIDANDAQTRADRLLGFTLDDIARKRGAISDRLSLALQREEQARRDAEANRVRSQFQSLFDSLRNQLNRQTSTLDSARSSIVGSQNAINNSQIQQANSSNFLVPNAGNIFQQTGTPQRVAGNIQSNGGGSLLQGRNALPGASSLSVRNPATGTARVTNVNPGRITGVSTAAPRQQIVGVVPGASRFRLSGVR